MINEPLNSSCRVLIIAVFIDKFSPIEILLVENCCSSREFDRNASGVKESKQTPVDWKIRERLKNESSNSCEFRETYRTYFSTFGENLMRAIKLVCVL